MFRQLFSTLKDVLETHALKISPDLNSASQDAILWRSSKTASVKKWSFHRHLHLYVSVAIGDLYIFHTQSPICKRCSPPDKRGHAVNHQRTSTCVRLLGIKNTGGRPLVSSAFREFCRSQNRKLSSQDRQE